MTDPTAIPADVRASLHEHAARLKHDLGKYIAFQARWLAADPDSAELADALRSDLLATRRGPSGSSSCTEVWAGCRAAFVGEVEHAGHQFDLSSDPDVLGIDGAMRTIEARLPQLASPSPDHAVLDELRGLALTVADHCRALERRLRRKEA